jgi:hypothetical protein
MKKYVFALLLLLLTAPARAEDAYFLGWGTPPAMTPATLTWMSTTSFVFDGIGSLIEDSPIQRMRYFTGGLEPSTMLAHEAKKLMYAGGEIPFSLYAYPSKQIDIFINAYSDQTLDPRLYPDEYLKGDTMQYLDSLTDMEGYYLGIAPSPAVNFPEAPSGFGPSTYINSFLLNLYARAKIYACLYSLARYVMDGEQQSEPVMIDAGGVKFMPGVRVAYGDFGPEVYLDVYGRAETANTFSSAAERK